MTTSHRSSCIADGDLNPTLDVGHLSEKAKWKRKQSYLYQVHSHSKLVTASGLELQFDLHFLENEKLERVKAVKSWKRDGMVSVATISCKRCVEINSVRPTQRGYSPFSCLVRAWPEPKDLRQDDDSQICACCSGLGLKGCRAWGGSNPQVKVAQAVSEKSQKEADCKKQGKETRERTMNRDHNVDTDTMRSYFDAVPMTRLQSKRQMSTLELQNDSDPPLSSKRNKEVDDNRIETQTESQRLELLEGKMKEKKVEIEILQRKREEGKQLVQKWDRLISDLEAEAKIIQAEYCTVLDEKRRRWIIPFSR